MRNNRDTGLRTLAEELELHEGRGQFWPYFVPFVWGWWYTRRWLALLASLPGILAGGTVGCLLVLGAWTPHDRLLDQYQASAEAALSRGDSDAAQLYFRRLTALNAASPSVRYGIALTAVLQGDQARARTLMQTLAPEDSGGYPDAHRWLAQDLISRNRELTPESVEIVEHHLCQVLAHDEGNREAIALMAAVLWSRGDTRKALPYVEQMAEESPEWNLPLAALYQTRGDPAAARRAAQRAAAHYRQLVQSNPRAWRDRLHWAQSEAMQENYSQAATILRAGLAAPDPQVFHDALVGVYLAWYAATAGETPEGLATRLELLDQALAHGPSHPRVLTLVAEASGRGGEQSETARQALQEALADGKAPATVHLILGTQALEEGDWDRCQMHLELASQLAPQTPLVLNNLAWVLAKREPPELQRALELAQRAKQLSDHPEIAHTLGTILARSGRYVEAIAEVEAVLRLLPERPNIHRLLAEWYEKLGNSELAEIYRRRAEALQDDGDAP
jgi:tetratricopeptide (TPR) repeat protein